ncbi:MAG: hypothetical protein GX483_06325 [Actinomycetaceae bacterium]|nr:hypothetical protein [Actinomycetaceae bacterium]
MARNNDQFGDIDRQWEEYSRQIREQGPGSPANSRPAGPRDWTPPEIDEYFDPAELPSADPVSRPSNASGAKRFFIVGILCLAIVVAGFWGLISLPKFVMTLFAIGGVASFVAAVFFNAPHESDPDDDGARL